METKVLKDISDLEKIANLKSLGFRSGLKSIRVKSLKDFIDIANRDFPGEKCTCQITESSVQAYIRKECEDGTIEELACKLLSSDLVDINDIPDTGSDIDNIIDTLRRILA